MSAETLTRAATAIREEWGEPRGGAWASVQQFHLAVADWLDSVAGWQNVTVGEWQHALTVARTYLNETA